jgi:hypothetical protein
MEDKVIDTGKDPGSKLGASGGRRRRGTWFSVTRKIGSVMVGLLSLITHQDIGWTPIGVVNATNPCGYGYITGTATVPPTPITNAMLPGADWTIIAPLKDILKSNSIDWSCPVYLYRTSGALNDQATGALETNCKVEEEELLCKIADYRVLDYSPVVLPAVKNEPAKRSFFILHTQTNDPTEIIKGQKYEVYRCYTSFLDLDPGVVEKITFTPQFPTTDDTSLQ